MRAHQQSTLREYVKGISDEDLRFVGGRLVERFGGDLPDALNVLARARSVDEVLRSAYGPEDLYEMCDFIRDLMLVEADRRGIQIARA